MHGQPTQVPRPAALNTGFAGSAALTLLVLLGLSAALALSGCSGKPASAPRPLSEAPAPKAGTTSGEQAKLASPPGSDADGDSAVAPKIVIRPAGAGEGSSRRGPNSMADFEAVERPAESGLAGIWEQYAVVDSETDIYLGEFAVSRLGDEYQMSARTQVQHPLIINSLGIFDVEYDGDIWTFRSDWGDGNIGRFVLERESEDVFEGHAWLGDEPGPRTRWVRRSVASDGSN